MAGNKAAVYNMVIVGVYMATWISCCVIFGGGLFESHYANFNGVPVAMGVSLTTTFMWNRISNAYFGTYYSQYGTPNVGLDSTASHCNDASIPLILCTVFGFIFCTIGIVLVVLRAADKQRCLPCFNSVDSFVLFELIVCGLAFAMVTIADLFGWLGCFMWEGLKDSIYTQWVPSGLLYYIICNIGLAVNLKLLNEVRNDPMGFSGKAQARPAVQTGAPVSYPQSTSTPSSTSAPFSSTYAGGPPSHAPPPPARGGARV